MKKEIGKITHFFSRISVAVVDLTSELTVGAQVSMEGSTTSFEQRIDSMQIEKQNIEVAKAGDQIAIKANGRVRPGDVVYLVTPD